jgi:outer membrane biosynthesis protein TonB
MKKSEPNPHRPGGRQILASIALHLAVVLVAWWGHRAASEPIEYIAYQMSIVSLADLEMPDDAALPEPDDLIVETPDDPVIPDPEPEPPIPDPIPEVRPDPPPPPPVVEPPPRTEPPPTQAPPTRQADTPPPDQQTTQAGATDLAVRMQGLERDYPAYYRTIVTQIQACLRWTQGGRWTTVLQFTINRDGSIPPRSIRRQSPSGNVEFDMAAIGAVECAGRGRLGPLPEDLPFDELPIQFTFQPRGGGG